MDSTSMSDEMKRWSENFVKKIKALEEENKTLKLKNLKLTQEAMSKSSENRYCVCIERQEDRANSTRRMLMGVESESESVLMRSTEIPIPVPVTIDPIQIAETLETCGMSRSVQSTSFENDDSHFEETCVKEGPVDEFVPDNPQTERSSMNDHDIAIDIKEEDVGYEHRKSKSVGDNSVHDHSLVSSANDDQSSDIPIKHEIDKSIQRMFNTPDQVSNTETVSEDVDTEIGTDRVTQSGGQVLSTEPQPEPEPEHLSTEGDTQTDLNQSSTSWLTRNVQKKPHLTTRTAEKIPCPTCCETFDTKFKLMEHNKSHTTEKEVPTNPEPMFKCSVCERSFSRKSSLTLHMKTHTGGKKKPSSSLQTGKGLSAKRSLTVEKVNPRGRPKKHRKVESEAEVYNEEVEGVGEKIDSIDPHCVQAQETNPFMIEKVVSTLFAYVEDKDLKSCRLVCREWNRLTLPYTRSIDVLIGRWPYKGIDLDIESFVEHMEVSNRLGLGFPFGRFCIECLESTHEGIVLRFAQLCQTTVREYRLDGEVNQMTLSTLLKYAPHLTSLEVPCTLSAKNEKLIQLFPIEAEKPSLEYLRTLRITGDSETGVTGVEGNCPTYFDELFGIAQSITTLELESYNTDADSIVLNGLLKFGKVEFIQSMEIGDVTVQHLDVLKKMTGLKLKHLDLGLGTLVQNEEYSSWFELLELFKGSLISLGISTNSNPIIFPPMPKLQVLMVVVDDESKVRCLENECFNTTFPSLKKLSLTLHNETSFLRDEKIYLRGESDSSEDEEWNERMFKSFLTPGGSPTPAKSLFLRHYQKMNTVMFRNIQSIFNFSTLRMLECSVEKDGGEVVRQIWTHLTQLEGLSIDGTLPASENMDSLITGIPVSKIRQMVGNLTNSFKLLGKMSKGNREKEISRLIIKHRKHRKLPSIHNLTNLKSLLLCLRGRKTKSVLPNYVTDLTGYLGLYSLQSLQHLYVLRSKITHACARVLAKERSKCLKTWDFGSFTSKEIKKQPVNSDKYSFPYAICGADYNEQKN